MTSTITRPVTAAHQTGQPADRRLHSANAGVLVERVAQVAAGRGADARAALREMASGVNEAGVDVVMDLVDQLHSARGTMHRLLNAIGRQERDIQERLLATLEELDDARHR